MTGTHVAGVLRRFGFRQTIKGAVVIGVLGGLMMGAYGSAIVKVYPTDKERQELVKTLEAAPAINFLSGEVKDAGTPASYSIYKSLPMMVLVTSLWGLAVSTRLLRGDEEDGRTEVLASGAIGRRGVATALLAGFGGSFLTGVVIMWVLTALLGMAPGVNLSMSAALYMTLAVFLPGLVFMGVGVLTSQLALTRTRAMLYGAIPLIVLFAVRGMANTSDQLNWLKAWSPFGWSDLMDSVLDPQPIWIIPSLLFASIFALVGIYFVERRDYGTALLAEDEEVEPNFRLLSSPLTFALRLKKMTFFWWFVGTVITAVFMAALAGTVSDLLKDSSGLPRLAAFSPEQIKLLFIGESFMVVGLVLLAMVILEIGSIRREEAKLYLDNLLVQPVKRLSWLVGRLVIIGDMVALTAIAAALAIWFMAVAQEIDFTIINALQSLAAVIAGVILVGGIGIFLYGVWPRLSVIGMTIIVGWAFVVDILRNLLQLDDWVEKTSVLYYIPIDPSKSVEWTGIVWLIGIGVVLGALGIVRFTRRDISGE